MVKQVLPLAQLQPLARKIYASSDAEKIEQDLALILRFYGLINYQFSYSSSLWRGVLCPSAEGHSNIGRVGHPPPALSKNGRLNEAGKPLLYTSANQFAVLEEIGVQPGDFVHVVAYAFKPGEQLRAGIVGEITQVHRWGTSFTSDHLSKELNRVMNGMEFEVGKSFVFTDAFLSSVLRDRNASADDYLRSRILARLLFAKQNNLEAIIYPSIAIEGSRNIAIKPDAADTKLFISATFVIRVKQKYDYGIYDFEIVRRAKGQFGDGTIDWQ